VTDGYRGNPAVVISKGMPKKFGINPATVQLHPPGIPHEIARDRIGGSNVKRHRVTA